MKNKTKADLWTFGLAIIAGMIVELIAITFSLQTSAAVGMGGGSEAAFVFVLKPVFYRKFGA